MAERKPTQLNPHAAHWLPPNPGYYTPPPLPPVPAILDYNLPKGSHCIYNLSRQPKPNLTIHLGGEMSPPIKNRKWEPFPTDRKHNLMVEYGGVDVRSALPPPPKIGGRIYGSGNTTLMIRNIPIKYRMNMLTKFLDDLCRNLDQRAATMPKRLRPLPVAYDFLYLPMDFERGDNFGYAFVNFTNPLAAHWVKRCLHDLPWKDFSDGYGQWYSSKKICEIGWGKIQGKHNLMKHFRSKIFFCLPNLEYLPVEFKTPRNGYNLSPPTPMGLCFPPKHSMNQTYQKRIAAA